MLSKYGRHPICAAAEIRRGKKEEEEETTGRKYNDRIYYGTLV